VSLNHPDPTERRKLMPVENKYPVKQVIDLLKSYDLNKQRRISFEYIMLAGVNDSLQQANDTVRLLSGLRCRVNLIRFHAIPGSSMKSSGEQVIQQFADALNRKGIIATIRQSRGMDIDAACGMLSTIENQK
jgi:23S rRNA (adenine2503-C2)-methyltransferase